MHVGNDADGSERGRAHRANGRDHNPGVERVGQRLTLAEPAGDFKQVPALNLTGDDERIDPALDNLVHEALEWREILGQALFVETDFLDRRPTSPQAVGGRLVPLTVM